jgi:hypothetical protein
MSRRRRVWIAGATALVALVAAVGVRFFLSNRERPYDRSFDASVAEPAYTADGPVVLYDEGHFNTHTTARAYKPFADLIRNDGYELQVTSEPMSTRTLTGAALLVVVCARGANDANDDDAFTGAEADAVEQWVRGGGSLLLVTDHWPYGPAVASLAERFGVRMGGGLVEDPEQHEPDRGASHLVFSRDNGLLREHPIVRGRHAGEQIGRVLTFTGQSLLGSPEAGAFLEVSGTAIEYPPTEARVERRGGDLRVHMEYADPVAAEGRAQGIALEVDRGRIVVLGDAGMLRAQVDSRGLRVGMNVPGYDNRQLAINVMHWLSRVL